VFPTRSPEGECPSTRDRTSGIGSAAALALRRLDADGIVYGRNAAAGEAVVEELHGIGADGTFVTTDG